MNLATPLAELDGIPPQRVRALERFGLRSVGDLLTHFPRRHEDRRQFDRFPSEECDTPVSVCGIVAKTATKRFGGWKKMFEVTLEEENAGALSTRIVCRWFNVHFVQKMIATGQRLVVFGKPKLRAKKIVIDHPEFEIVENDEDVSIHLKRIVPIHAATEGITPRVLRTLIFRTLERAGDLQIETRLPAKLDSMPLAEALRQIHFPDNAEMLVRARRHLVLDEFFAMQLCVAAKRAETVARRGEPHCGPGALMEKLHAALPFPLTGAQRRAIAEIRADLAAPHPMNRLLHGDVGSGKTLVALSAMLLAVESGCQAALMAPTQILAEQHYLNFKRLLEPLGVKIALRTGSRREDNVPLPLFEKAALESPGSTRVPRVGEGVAPSRTSADADLPGDAKYTKRNLPHFEQPWAIYAVTFSTRTRRHLSPTARTIVLDALRHFHNQRYELFAVCVMPDHAHFLFQPWPKERPDGNEPLFWTLTELLHSLKSFTAHEINRAENRSGAIWEKESFDRYVRSDRDLQEKFQYILRNPWDAGVAAQNEDYRWVWTQEDEVRTPDGSSSRRDASTSTRDARAPRSSASAPLSDSEPQVFIGTHALLYESNANFSKLGLIVIDEQHKFGVMQRARLIDQAVAPDVLVMTATPIPRTLTMTVYGDLDVSTLDEMPAGRGKIITAARDESKLPDVVKFIREQLEAGRQAYIVYPLIDESEKLEAKAAAGEFEKWRTLLQPMRCELLHGRIDAAEKDAIMERFRRGESKVLVATTVIEVGIDVPNANIMLIENAERFGLAQLHQLRGRIGRGAHKSYCILISGDPKNDAAMEKLKTLERTSDGFEIAEEDLKLRGPGDILGTAQSGLAPLKIGNLLTDADLIKLARKAATDIFKTDPHLQRPENKRFRELIVEGKKSVLSQVS
jgi:RecG-like helicase/REP element-mobilizing transposase RayT